MGLETRRPITDQTVIGTQGDAAFCKNRAKVVKERLLSVGSGFMKNFLAL